MSSGDLFGTGIAKIPVEKAGGLACAIIDDQKDCKDLTASTMT
jgi:hypothetical protein